MTTERTLRWAAFLAGLFTWILLGLVVLVEEPLERQYRQCLEEVQKAQPALSIEEIRVAFPKLTTAERKLEEISRLRSREYHLTGGPAPRLTWAELDELEVIQRKCDGLRKEVGDLLEEIHAVVP